MADILDNAVEFGGFKTFVAAVQAAGLVETLKGKGPFTLLVPDDDAIAKLPAGTVDGLLKNVPKLRAILMYHILPGKLTVDEIAQMKTAKTVQGQGVKIAAAHWWTLHINPLINDAYMINTDIVTDNGMIHVLSRVLMPNMELTCPACGMGFMTMNAMNTHTKMGHVAEKVPEPVPPAEVPMPPALVMPMVEKAPEPLPPTEVLTESMPLNIFSEYSWLKFSFCGKTDFFGFSLRFNPTCISKPFIRIRENYLNLVCHGSSHEQSGSLFYKYNFLIADVFQKKNYSVVGQYCVCILIPRGKYNLH